MSSGSSGIANDCFGGALLKLLRDPKYQSLLKDLTYCSHLLTVIDSAIPGASDALLAAIMTAVVPPA
jgi:hypothetical protein